MVKANIPLKEQTEMNDKNIKKISVSAKRQMTIPKQFYDELNLGNEVLCEIVDDALIIRRVQDELDFSEFILSDLIKEGYEGEALVKEFKYRKAQTHNVVHTMIEQTRDYKTYETVDELFDSLDDDEENE